MARAELSREIATPTVGGPRAATAWRPLASLTPARVAQILRRALSGDARDFLLAADEVADKDLHYRAVLATRQLAVAALPLEVAAGDESAAAHAAAELVRGAFDRLPIAEIISHLMDAVAKGYAVSEILWDTQTSPWLPRAVRARPAHWFRWDAHAGALRLLSEAAPQQGEPLAESRFVVHQVAARDTPLAAALARPVLWAWVIKSYALRDWARFLEMYGQPLRVGKYDAGASPQDVDVLKEAVLGLGADAAAVIPAGMMIELVEAAGKGASGDLYQRLLEYLDRAVSKAVLGQTLTTDQGASGSLAQARVHEEVRRDLLRADATALAATLTRDLVAPLVRLNLGDAAPLPVLTLRVDEPEDLQALAEQIERLVKLGLPVPQAWARAKWGIPEPDGAEPLLRAPAAGPIAGMAGRVAGTPMRGLQATQNSATPDFEALPRADALDALVDEAMAGWRQQMGPVVAPLEALFARAEREGWSAEELIDALAPTLAEPHEAALNEALARAAFAARLAGVHGREELAEAPEDGGDGG